MRTLKLSIALIFCLMCCYTLVSGQSESKIYLEYTNLQKRLTDSTYIKQWSQIDYFLKLTEPFYQLTQNGNKIDLLKVPGHLDRMDPAFFATPEGKRDWLEYSYQKVSDLNDFDRVVLPTVGKKLFATFKIEAVNHPMFRALDADRPLLVNNKNFRPLINAIIALNFEELITNTQAYNKEVRENLAKYQAKYRPGYRNRNILDYFLMGGIRGIKDRRQRKNGKFDNNGGLTLLSPPGRVELILLSNPILTVGSPSLKGFKKDPKSLYVMSQIVGFDFFRADFEKYYGVSIFHASPIDTEFTFFERPYIGLEFHFNKEINLGVATEYSVFNSFSQEDYGLKVFLTVAIFDRFFPKNQQQEIPN